MYLFFSKTEEGTVTGKIINNKIPRTGSDYSSTPENSLDKLKNTQNWEAIYDIIVTAEGYNSLSQQEIINGTINLIYSLTPDAGIPQQQDLGGIIVDKITGNLLSGVTARVREQGTNDLLGETITNSNGEYLLEDIPAGKNVYFVIGGLSDHFAFNGDEYELPDVIQVEADTSKLVFNYDLGNKIITVPGSGGLTVNPFGDQIDEMYIGPQSELGAGRNILWDQMMGWTNEIQREGNRTLMNNFMNLFGLNGKFVEVFDTLNQNGTGGYNVYNNYFPGEIGMNIRPGGDQTNSFTENIVTNLGNSMTGSPAANVTVSQNTNAFYKEGGRTIYLAEVTSRNSFMNPIPKDPNNLDRGITDYIVDHYIKMITEDKAYFGLNNIADNIPGKAPESIINNNKIRLNYSVKNPEKIAIEIYDQNNRAVNLDNQQFLPGEKGLEFNISHLPTGTYCTDIFIGGEIVESKSFERK